jgi:hypothetical protein
MNPSAALRFAEAVQRGARRGLRHRILPLLFALAATAALHASSVVPPSFPELVGEAQSIVEGRVAAQHCEWVDTPQGRAIMTFVTFDVTRTLKGPPQKQIVLRLLGGELDGEGLRVDGVPRFKPGDREILFVTGNGTRFCPLVGMMHGRYHIVSAATHAYVARDDGAPLVREQDVQREPGAPAAPSAAPALSPEAFEQRIRQEVVRHVVAP